MNKLLGSLAVSVSVVLLSSCGFNTVVYQPAYTTGYVSTVGYYNPYPYTNYYMYGLGNYGYWGSPCYYSGYSGC